MAVADWSEVATDDFNRSDGPIGTDYTTLYGTKPEVESNQLVAGSSGAEGACFWNQDSFDDDQYSEIELTRSTDGENFCGVMVRCGDVGSGGDGYLVWMDGDNDTHMYRVDNGVRTSIGSQNDPSVNDDCALEVIGSTLQWYINRTASGSSETDTNYTSGSAGVFAAYGSNPNGDNWNAGSVVSNVEVTPGVSAVAYTGYAPTIYVSQSATPGVSQVVLTGYAPTASLSDNKIAEPGVSANTLTGFNPTADITEHVTVEPGVSAVDLTGYAPTISISTDVPVFPGVSVNTITGYDPTVTVSDHQLAEPGVCVIDITNYPPIPSTSNHQWAYPGPGALIFEGFSPEVIYWGAGPPGRYWRMQVRLHGKLG